MKRYNKFYFLHVPKTGGRFFTEYILKPIEKTLEESGIEILRLPAGVNKHGGWHKDIDENTYVVSILRDPVEFLVSLVAHMESDKHGLIDHQNDQIINDKTITLDIDKQLLFNTIEELKYLKNFQSQNFILTPEDNNVVTYSRRLHNNGFDFDANIALLNERINKTSLMIRNIDLKFMNYSILLKKISNDLGIKINIDTSLINSDLYENNNSKTLLNKLTNEDTKEIYKNFIIDKKIYDNDALFWTGK